jgi:signal transduction histidine kinase
VPVESEASRSSRSASILNAWERLGEPSSTSVLVAWIFAPFGFLVAFTLDREIFGGSPLEWIGIAGLGQLVVLGALPSLGWLLHRYVATRFWSLGTLLIFLAVTSARGLVMDFTALGLGLSSAADWTHLLVSDVITQTGFLLVIAYRVSVRKGHARLMRGLEGERRELARLDLGLTQKINEIDERLAIQMGLTVEPRLRAIDIELNSVIAGNDPERLIDSLQTFVDDDIRPLSHYLSEPVKLPPIIAVPATKGEVARISLPATIVFSRMIWPIPAAVIVGLFTFGQVEWLSTLPEAIFYAPLIGLIIFSILENVRRLSGSRQVQLWLGVALAIVLNAAVIAISAAIVMVLGSAVPPFALGRSFAGGAFIGLLSALAAVADVHEQRGEQILREQLAELNAAINVSRQRLWATRRRLGYALHGSLQAALHVAAMRLSDHRVSNDDVVRSIRVDIAAAVSKIKSGAPEPFDFIEACQDLAGTWEGTCNVLCEVSAEAAAALNSSPTVSECALEVVVEAVQNAIRHGRATEVVVSVAATGDRLNVDVSDNGTSIDGVAGLGTRMMDELCVHWARVPLGSGTQLSAELMVS